MDENARKRKRLEEGVDSDGEPLGSEKPREGLKKKTEQQSKKTKKEEAPKANTAAATEKKPETVVSNEDKDKERRRRANERRRAKRELRRTKTAEAMAAKKTAQNPAENKATKDAPSTVGTADGEDEDDIEVEKMEGVSFSDLEPADKPTSPSTASSVADSSAFDQSNMPSGSSSISSMLPPDSSTTTEAQPQKPKIKIPKGPPPEELKQRLQKRLEELRLARHADGLNGRPARSRQELIEARRQREEKRKELKKAQREKEKEAQQLKEDEAMARRFSPTAAGSLLNSPRSPITENAAPAVANNFSFGRISFGDGAEAKADLSDIINPTARRKGPQDAATALKAAEAKQARLKSYDENKRKDIEEKDMWLNAKKRAHGERVRDDTSLLKKALKRKEGQKKKGEREWSERKEGVQKSIANKQRRREDNLQKRKDDKMSTKAGIKKKSKKPSSSSSKKSRPGFEGSFRTGGGGKGKK